MKLFKTEDLNILQFTWDILDSNCYVVKGNSSVLIIDPIDNDELFNTVKGYNAALVLLTHAHFDHICGLRTIREMIQNCKVLTSEACSNNIQNPKKNLSNIANALLAFQEGKSTVEYVIEPFSCKPADVTFIDEILIEWEGHSLQLSEYHGHSKDSNCIILDNRYLFSGDTILPIPTVTRLPGGSTRSFYYDDIPKLKRLQGEIQQVFPGHKNPGRLGDMILVNRLSEGETVQQNENSNNSK